MAVYADWLLDQVNDWLAGKTIKVMAVTSGYAQNQAASHRSDITAEVSGTGYTAGGVTATGVAASVSAGQLVITSDDIDFGAVTLTDIAGVIYYEDSGDPATDRLIVADTFAGIAVTDPETFVYHPDPAGLVVGVP